MIPNVLIICLPLGRDDQTRPLPHFPLCDRGLWERFYFVQVVFDLTPNNQPKSGKYFNDASSSSLALALQLKNRKKRRNKWKTKRFLTCFSVAFLFSASSARLFSIYLWFLIRKTLDRLISPLGKLGDRFRIEVEYNVICHPFFHGVGVSCASEKGSNSRAASCTRQAGNEVRSWCGLTSVTAASFLGPGRKIKATEKTPTKITALWA